MNKTYLLAAIIVACLAQSPAYAQSNELPKFEIAAEFTSLEREGFSTNRTEPGVGARFTYNLNENFALESAIYFFPKECFSCVNDGRVLQAVGGLKAGKRFEKWGIFAKARPGVVSFSTGEFDLIPTGPPPMPLQSFQIVRNHVNSFAIDLGAVVEFYVSKRIVTRFDAGDTLIHFTRRTTNTFRIDPLTNQFGIGPVTRPSRTTHSFQFMASVGFRF